MTSVLRGGPPSPWCPWASGQVAGTEEPVWLVWVFLSVNLAVSGKRAQASLTHGEAPEPSGHSIGRGCASFVHASSGPCPLSPPPPPGHSPYRPRKNPLFIVDLMLDTSGVHYSTPLEQFETSLLTLFDKGILATHTVPQLEKVQWVLVPGCCHSVQAAHLHHGPPTQLAACSAP